MILNSDFCPLSTHFLWVTCGITKFSTVREESGVKFELPKIQFERTAKDKIDGKRHLE